MRLGDAFQKSELSGLQGRAGKCGQSWEEALVHVDYKWDTGDKNCEATRAHTCAGGERKTCY